MPNALASEAATQTTFQTLVDTASGVLQAGKIEEARKACLTLTETHPDQPNSWFLYGLTTLQSGDTLVAIPALERAVAMHRANASYWRVLGRALRAAGRDEHAAEALEQALHLEPNHPEALLTLGLIRIAQGRKDVGTNLCRRGIKLGLKEKWRKFRSRFSLSFAPSIALVRRLADRSCSIECATAMSCAKICERLNEPDAALRYYQLAIENDPDYSPALAAAGRILTARHEFAAAIDYLEKASASCPEDPAVHIDLAISLSGILQFEEAILALQKLFALGVEPPRALLVLGRAQTGAGDTTAAYESFRKALNLAPNSAEARYALGDNRQKNGDFKAANSLFVETLAIDPSHVHAYRFLASNKSMEVGDQHFEQMLDLLQNGRLTAEKRSRLHFAASAVFEQAGDIDNAFAHLTAGNDLKDVIFDPASCASYFGSLIETFDAEFFKRTQNWGSQDRRPLFILGMMRSGTTLVEQILASHSEVFGAGELEAFNAIVDGLGERLASKKGYPDCVSALDQQSIRDMASDHLDFLVSLAGDRKFVSDKMPTNFLHIGMILTLFPNARIIHCRRDPRDTCFSIFSLDFGGNHPYAYNQTNLGYFYRQYERLMDHWHRVAPGSILDVQYEDLVADQETHTRRMLEFCGLDWDENCLDFHKTDRTVQTWSYNQVRKPIYKSSVARWRKFENHLAPLLAELDVPE